MRPSVVTVASCAPGGLSPSGAEMLSSVLDGDERSRMASLPDDGDRRGYLVAHALLRVALSRSGRALPSGWRFRRTRTGRPSVAFPRGPRLAFSLSRAPSLVACAVSATRRVGIDVESLDRRLSADDLFAYALTGAERRWCDQVVEGERSRRFLRLWTLKEAYGKARGTGFARPPSRYGFRFAADGTPRLEANGGGPGSVPRFPPRWSFRLFEIRGHACALAIGVPEREPVALEWADFSVEELVEAASGAGPGASPRSPPTPPVVYCVHAMGSRIEHS